MIANALILTIAILLALGFWLMGELKFFIPYRAVLLHQYGTVILAFLGVLFINVFAIAFAVNRRFFSRTQEGNSLTSISSYKSGRENSPHLRLNPLTRSWADNVALIFTR